MGFVMFPGPRFPLVSKEAVSDSYLVMSNSSQPLLHWRATRTFLLAGDYTLVVATTTRDMSDINMPGDSCSNLRQCRSQDNPSLSSSQYVKGRYTLISQDRVYARRMQ